MTEEEVEYTAVSSQPVEPIQKEESQPAEIEIKPEPTETELITALLNQWQDNTEGCVKVEESRYYIKSDHQYNREHYHIISKTWRELIISQTDESEKYQMKVTFSTERFLSIIAALLQQRLEDLESLNNDPDPLGGIDDHPF